MIIFIIYGLNKKFKKNKVAFNNLKTSTFNFDNYKK